MNPFETLVLWVVRHATNVHVFDRRQKRLGSNVVNFRVLNNLVYMINNIIPGHNV